MTDRRKEEEIFYNVKYSKIKYNNSITDLINCSIYLHNQSAYKYFFDQVSMNVLNKDVLECGCGIDNLPSFAETSNHFNAIDLSEEAIKYQQQRIHNSIINAEYHVMNLEKLNFDDNSFDVIFGKSILHHTDLEKTYREISRVLRPTGRAFFLEPIKYNPIVFLYRMLTPSIRTPTEHPLTIKDIKLAKIYFQHVNIKYFNFFSYMTCLPFCSSERNHNLINHFDEKFLNLSRSYSVRYTNGLRIFELKHRTYQILSVNIG